MAQESHVTELAQVTSACCSAKLTSESRTSTAGTGRTLLICLFD